MLMLASVRAVEKGRDPVSINNDFPAMAICSTNTVVSAEKPCRELGLPAELAEARA